MPGPDRHIVLFNLYAGGHHPQHMLLLAHAWAERKPGGRLSIAVPDFYRNVHPWFESELADLGCDNIHAVPLSGVPPAPPRGARELVKRDRLHGRLAHELVRKDNVTHIVFMFFDHVQVSLATDLRFETDVSMSGIYFRPSFHYPALSGYRPTLREAITNRRKRAILHAALRNPHLQRVFSLDPYLDEHLGKTVHGTDIVSLPDPVHFDIRDDVVDAVPPAGVMTFLLFGILDERKGLQATLRAAELLPDHLRQRIRFVLAGKLSDDGRSAALRQIERLRSAGIDIAIDDRYIPNDEMPRFFDDADIVLAPYQKHLGSSGVLVHAAASRTPVIGSDFGVVGENIRRHRLGIATDTTDPVKLAGVIGTVAASGSCDGFDTSSALAFARANTSQRFADTILDSLL